MDIEFIRRRITELRLSQNLSEYRLSCDLGHSKNYIQNIISGRTQPSLQELLSIIERLGVTPRDFFDEQPQYQNPSLCNSIIDGIKTMSDDDLAAVALIINRLNARNQ